MKQPIRKLVPVLRHRQRGVAAIEFAIVMPLLILVLAPLILWSRYMWHYTVLQKATQDAARYMSTVSVAEMASPTRSGYAHDIAVEIARREVAELAPGSVIKNASVNCDGNDCGGGPPPQVVSVYIFFYFNDPIFGTFLGPQGLLMKNKVTMRYVGK